MNGKLLLSFAVATFIAALATVWVLADVRRRLDGLETSRAPGTRTAPPTSIPASPASREPDAPPAGPEDDPETSRDPLVKLTWLVKKLTELSDNLYDYQQDQTGSTMDLKREVRQLKAQVRLISQALQKGQLGGLSWGSGIAPEGKPLSEAIVRAYIEDAKAWGFTVEEGRVTAPAMLNMSPRKDYPIEYFITRYPESGHETLVHLTGNKPLEEINRDPLHALKGLGTALYKALVAAGFKQGVGSHADPASPDPQRPRWLLPTGDTVFLYVRYTRGGQTHLARATDWVTDPSTGTVLPDDCFRFTGSRRGEDPDTGEEVLAAEVVGLLVSVWPNALALVEVALDSAIHNDYLYNSVRIPKPDGEGPLALELIFSKTRLEPEGDGALPIPPPQPRPPEPEKPVEPAVPDELPKPGER
jgi:hypothetical protein